MTNTYNYKFVNFIRLSEQSGSSSPSSRSLPRSRSLGTREAWLTDKCAAPCSNIFVNDSRLPPVRRFELGSSSRPLNRENAKSFSQQSSSLFPKISFRMTGPILISSDSSSSSECSHRFVNTINPRSSSSNLSRDTSSPIAQDSRGQKSPSPLPLIVTYPTRYPFKKRNFDNYKSAFVVSASSDSSSSTDSSSESDFVSPQIKEIIVRGGAGEKKKQKLNPDTKKKVLHIDPEGESPVKHSSMVASLSMLEKIAAMRGAADAGPSIPTKPSMSATTTGAESSEGATARLKLPGPPAAPINVIPPEKEVEGVSKGQKMKFEEINVGFPYLIYFRDGWEFDKDMFDKGREIGPRIEALPREKWLGTSAKLSIANQFIMSVPGSVDFLKECIDELKGEIVQ
ncbi:uncharacterized protein LOC133304016 [Gastrolobium bilobum]|uniref:uncharacterized protein LOC133304016 n=1 Tax=Gastrolobium bilobum TaxID=150636 RepID=UPI002AB0D514|nr:uncharacterized protein LOC133304016 [Gastrolobium bilobum]